MRNETFWHSLFEVEGVAAVVGILICAVFWIDCIEFGEDDTGVIVSIVVAVLLLFEFVVFVVDEDDEDDDIDEPKSISNEKIRHMF